MTDQDPRPVRGAVRRAAFPLAAAAGLRTCWRPAEVVFRLAFGQTIAPVRPTRVAGRRPRVTVTAPAAGPRRRVRTGARRLLGCGLAAWLGIATAAAAQVPGLPKAVAEDAAAPSPAPLELKSPDAEIAARLRALFADIEGLQDVRPEVRGGVVILRGATLTAAEGDRAENIAGRLAGVVAVENALVTEHRVSRRVQPLLERAREVGRSTLDFAPLLLVALLTFLGFWLLGRALTRSTRIFRKIAPNPFVENLVEQAIRLGFLIAGLLAAMSILGATALLGSVLGAAGLVGLAVGFAVRDTIENYIASILLSVRQPFAPNDLVSIAGHEGRVTRLNSRATLLMTLDGNEVRIPNATVYKSVILNFTRSPERRFEFEVGVGYENDLSRAQAIALGAAKSVPGLLPEPPPSAIVHQLDAYAVVVKVFGWVDQSRSDFLKVRSETIRRVKAAYDEAAISMPEPIQNVRTLNDAPSAPPQLAPSPAAPAEMAEISDTTADHTIKEKVHHLRATGEEDLLSPHATRE